MRWYLMIDYSTEKVMYGGLFKNITEFLISVQSWLTMSTEDFDYKQIIDYEKEEIGDDYNVHFITINDYYSLEDKESLRMITAYNCAVYEVDMEDNLINFPEKLRVT